MGRPTKPRALDSFPHPCGRGYNRDIQNLKVLILMYGNDAYVFYYRVLEMVYSQENCNLVLDERTRLALIDLIRVKPQKFDDMLAAALEVRLFDPGAYEDTKVITSPTIRAVASSAFKKRDQEKARYRAKTRVSGCVPVAENPQIGKEVLSPVEDTVTPATGPVLDANSQRQQT